MTQKVYLNMKDINARYGISQATVFRWIANDQFPKGIKIGTSRRWHIDELLEYERQRREIEQKQAS